MEPKEPSNSNSAGGDAPDNYSTLESVADDKSSRLPERLAIVPEGDKQAYRYTQPAIYTPALPTPRNNSTTSIDAEKNAEPEPAKPYFLCLSRPSFLFLISAIALLAISGSAVGIGLLVRSGLNSNSNSRPGSSPSASSVADESGSNTTFSLNATAECQTVPVLFSVQAPTNWGEEIFVAGNTTALGNWDPARAVPLSSDNYTQTQPLWFAETDLQADETLSYVYVRREGNGNFVWETSNRTLEVGTGGCGEGEQAGGGNTKEGQRVDDRWTGPGAGLSRRANLLHFL